MTPRFPAPAPVPRFVLPDAAGSRGLGDTTLPRSGGNAGGGTITGAAGAGVVGVVGAGVATCPDAAGAGAAVPAWEGGVDLGNHVIGDDDPLVCQQDARSVEDRHGALLFHEPHQDRRDQSVELPPPPVKFLRQRRGLGVLLAAGGNDPLVEILGARSEIGRRQQPAARSAAPPRPEGRVDRPRIAAQLAGGVLLGEKGGRRAAIR